MSNTEWIVRSNEIRGLAALLLKFFNDDVNRRMQNSGEQLSSLHFGILQMLQFETLTVSTISKRMGMDPSSIVRIIDSLERKGLAARGIDPHDRRRNPIQITGEGQALLAAVPAVSAEDSTVQALQSLGDERALQLRDLLIKLLLRIPEGKAILLSAPRPADYVMDTEDAALLEYKANKDDD